ELAFHQLRRNGAAVDWHKGMAGPRSEGMDAPGNQFLAAAGLTTDIEGSLAAGELGDLPAQLLDRRRGALDRIVRVLGNGLFPWTAEAQRAVDQLAQALQVN